MSSCAALVVDLGGPIIRQQGIETEGSFEALRMLRESRFGDRLHVISQCDAVTETRRRIWLEEHDFFRRSGLCRDQLHFCREVWEKAELCSRLGVTCCVENSIPVMKNIRTVPFLFLYHPSREEMAHPAHAEFMRYVYDPDVHRAEDAELRPITLIRTWTPQTIRLIQSTPIFRHLPWLRTAPHLRPSSRPPPLTSSLLDLSMIP